MVNKPLSTLLSLLLLMLSVGMISFLLEVNRNVNEQMNHNLKGIDMVVGAKGSPLQLVLSAVYHIDAPTGNIPLNEALKLKKNRFIASATPLSYGDSYKGYRIVGTDSTYPELFSATIQKGRLWTKSMEVTIGSNLAKKLNLKLGDTFAGGHGLIEGGETHEEHQYTVVGIFNATNSILDQLILTSSESVWDIHDHEEANHDHHHKEMHQHEEHDHKHSDEEEHTHHEHHDENHEEEEGKQITALLVKFRNPMGYMQVPRMINEKTNMQAAIPSFEVSRLSNLLGFGIDTLSSIALILMLVSGFSIFISLFNALKNRKHEMALLRTYGASRFQLVWLIMQEAVLLTFIGFVLGIVSSKIGLVFFSSLVDTDFHYSFSSMTIQLVDVWLLLFTLLVGVLASLLPSIQAYRVDLSRTLADE